jgi:tripartite-type tricarboxylate transporter receptor subunit TctC
VVVLEGRSEEGIVQATPIPPELDYPSKPVRVIEPFGAGGGVEVLALAVTERLSDLWDQPVTVENHPGAGSTAGPALVAKSPGDGYTLLVNTNAHAISAALLTNLPYDPLKDFIPIAPLTSQSYVLVAGTRAAVSTVGELIAAAKGKPGELRFGSSGVGTGTHLGVEKFNLEAGIKAMHVPARGADAIADTIANTIAGHTTYALSPIPPVLSHLREGRLVALGVSGAQRSRALPGVPTIAEAGVAGFDYPIWYGIWAPAGTPAGVVHKLAQDIAQALSEPDLRDWIVNHGAAPMSMAQADFARFVLSESESAARIIEAARIKRE